MDHENALSDNRHLVVHDFLTSAVKRHAYASAVRDTSGSWNYSELDVASARVANWLISHGVRPGDRVAVRAGAHRVVAAALYGCSRVGAIFLPMSCSWKPYQLEVVLEDADPVLVLTDDLAQAERWPCRTYDLAGLFSLAVTGHDDAELVPCLPDPRDPVFLLYTSGSTARPKGVLCTHEQVCFAARAVAERLRYRPDDVVFCRLPLSFDYGLYQILLATLAGSELVLADTHQHAGLMTQMQRCGATVMPMVPSLATMLLTLARREHEQPPVRLFTNTGEHLSAATAHELRKQFPGAGVQMMFGTTECKRISIGDVDGDLNRPNSVGRPLCGTEVQIVNDANQPLPPGEVGEIVVRGPHLMAGYWRDPTMTRQVYRIDPVTGDRVLHTGDYGWLDTDGYLYFHGRRDNLFKRRATRVSTTEIEAAAQALPGVHIAVAIPPTGDQDLTLYITGTSTPAEVLRAIRTMLDPAKVPATCQSIDELPLTSNGKIDRSRLAARVPS